MKKQFIIIFLLMACAMGQVVQTTKDYQVSSERFITGENGNIFMFVNVWGHVNSPGRHTVYDGIDLATLMSVVGGPKSGANMKKVRVYRESPEKDGTLVYHLDFQKFISSGDRSEFIKIQPNDTIIIPEKMYNYFLTQVGTLNTFLSLFNLYFQLKNI